MRGPSSRFGRFQRPSSRLFFKGQDSLAPPAAIGERAAAQCVLRTSKKNLCVYLDGVAGGAGLRLIQAPPPCSLGAPGPARRAARAMLPLSVLWATHRHWPLAGSYSAPPSARSTM